MLDQDGIADANSQGKWIDAAGDSLRLTNRDVRLQVLETWQSRTGQEYPIRWRIDYKDKSWIIRAAVKDQLMDLAVSYWEGAVEIYDSVSMQLVGRGYLEMTRIQ